MALRYRPALITDIPELKAIRDAVRENALVTPQISEADYLQALTVDGRAWVCEDDAKVVGFVCGRPQHSDIWALFLRQSHEGRGIGNHLMEIIEEWMFAQGVEEIGLTTDAGTRAERLYQRRGWQLGGNRAGNEVRYTLSRSR
jgi:GNAT superfamily N-acetyltransferase